MTAAEKNALYSTPEMAARAIIGLSRACVVQPTGQIVFVHDERELIDRIVALAASQREIEK
jgi:hypothetical protein